MSDHVKLVHRYSTVKISTVAKHNSDAIDTRCPNSKRLFGTRVIWLKLQLAPERTRLLCNLNFALLAHKPALKREVHGFNGNRAGKSHLNPLWLSGL